MINQNYNSCMKIIQVNETKNAIVQQIKDLSFMKYSTALRYKTKALLSFLSTF